MRVHISIDADLLGEVTTEAEKQGRNRSNMITAVLKAWLEGRKKRKARPLSLSVPGLTVKPDERLLETAPELAKTLNGWRWAELRDGVLGLCSDDRSVWFDIQAADALGMSAETAQRIARIIEDVTASGSRGDITGTIGCELMQGGGRQAAALADLE